VIHPGSLQEARPSRAQAPAEHRLTQFPGLSGMQLGAFLAAYEPTLEPLGWITIPPPPQIGCHVATDSFSMVNGAERPLANVCQHDEVASRAARR
jgi:hypothetical protein